MPATPIALPASSGGSSERTYAPAAASSGRDGGSEPRKRSVSLTQPTSRLVANAMSSSSCEHELGRAAADVHDQDIVERGPARRDAADHHRGLLGAGEQARREAVAPLDLAEERLAVLGVAHGARGDAQRPLGAELFQLPSILREAVPDARDGHGEEAAALVHALRRAG